MRYETKERWVTGLTSAFIIIMIISLAILVAQTEVRSNKRTNQELARFQDECQYQGSRFERNRRVYRFKCGDVFEETRDSRAVKR